jgi:hypothetical protein
MARTVELLQASATGDTVTAIFAKRQSLNGKSCVS